MVFDIPSLHTLLREGTEVAHRRVEGHPLLRPLLAPELTLAQYARVIAAFSGFFQALEPRLVPLLEGLADADYGYIARSPLLAEDLDALPSHPIARCHAVPEPGNQDELVGILYVLEGATQGGRVIAPQLGRTLGLGEGAATRYFQLYQWGSWRQFCAMMARHPDRWHAGLATGAARMTFESLYQHLDHCLSTH